MKGPYPIRFPDGMLQELEATQARRLDAPGLSTIVRELVAEALEARRRKGKRS